MYDREAKNVWETYAQIDHESETNVKFILNEGEKTPFNISKMPLKQNHGNISHIFRTRRDERLRVKYIEDITQWRKDMNSEQRTYKSRGKTHAVFTRYISFHTFISENVENTSVLVYGKTPIT